MIKFRLPPALLRFIPLVATISGAAAPAAYGANVVLKPVALRCEYRVDPLGIDEPKPRLSWLLETNRPDVRGQRQSAYQILVASTREKLDADDGDLWNTEKVESDATSQIVYGGKPPASGQVCWWKVRIYNGGGDASEWSAAAKWSMGLLQPGDWKAKWIGYDEPDQDRVPDETADLNLERCKWAWTDEGDATKDAPEGTRYFRRRIALPPEGNVVKAHFVIAADNRFTLFVNGKKAGTGDDFRDGSMIDIKPMLRKGDNILAIEATNDKVGPAGLCGRVRIAFDTGDVTMLDVDRTWKFSREKQDGWEKIQADVKAWPQAKEVGPIDIKPWGMPTIRRLDLPPPPMLRKKFATTRPVKRATVYATALGLYELHVNGKRVAEDVLTPGWTDYKKRVYYNTYDVTELLRQGDNVLAAILGDGWYAGYFSYQGKRGVYGPNPRMMAQLVIEYDDGTSETIATDDAWKATHGPYREGDLLQGAAYDARKEMPGWDAADFDDDDWDDVDVDEPPKIAVQGYPGDPVRRHEEISAKSVSEPEPGKFVFDLGQNMVGWVRLKVTAEKGRRIVLRHSEMLSADGTLYTTSLRRARATDTYFAKGGGEETWEPKFTFHGFRYVEVTGLKGKPSLDTVTGIVAHASMPRTGEFECSNGLVNQLFHNIIWGQKGNYLEVPTDCPQRDERLGWTGDAQFFIPTGTYNFDVSAFFTKWLIDLIDDAQHEDGSFADVAPDLLGGHGNVAWGDAGIVCPYVIYRMYGDTRVIERHYPAMAKYLYYLEKTSTELIRGQGEYGDWLNLGGGAKSEVVGTAYFEHMTRLMGEMAAAVGKNDDAKRYRELADDIRQAFIRSFVTADGKIKESSQTGYALAFTMDLLPAERRAKAAENFVEEIKAKDWHLATGFIGTPRLLPALTRAGRSDIACKLLLTDTFPSWLCQVKLGATTMWERWDGWTPDKGFQNPAMNSFNHYAFGSVGEWMYRTLAGIDAETPGFKKIIIRPHPCAELGYAKASLRSINGTIETEWRREGDVLLLNVTVPPNTTATVYVPAREAATVSESGAGIGQAEGVKFLWMQDGAAVFRVGSGKYRFEAKQ